MTPKSKAQMRHIDTVTVKGSSQPMELYTCDVDTSELNVEQKEKKSFSRQEKKMRKIRARVERNRLKQ